MPFVLISTPVYQREWILPDWLRCIEKQDFPLSDIGFQFEAAPGDDPTINVLMDFHSRHPEVRCFDVVLNEKEKHTAHPEGARTWKREQYAVMANMRNNLLSRAICRQPDKMFSLDSDILIEEPDTISRLYRVTEDPEIHAASPLCYMTPADLDFPNIMTWGVNGQGYRQSTYPIGETFQVDVIMAAVMMTPKAYSTARYYYHRQGEDVGWAQDCTTQGINLFSVSSIYAAHIMGRAVLSNYKQYGDVRQKMLAQKALEIIS